MTSPKLNLSFITSTLHLADKNHGRISISGACFDVGRGIIFVQQERTYYKTLHGTCITKALKKPKPRKVGIFDVGTEKDPNQLSIVGCSLCAATTLSDDGSRAYARFWKIQEDYVCLDGYEGINGWENMDGLENSTVTWNSTVASVENYTAMKYPVDCLHYTHEKTFIEQVVADESDMEDVPPACSRILNWHLHLAALDVPYPQGWANTDSFGNECTNSAPHR
ncbi:hypothetical protein HID58_082419 [Brassica napus]|uniref:Uncharacterized protein n=1 Tax=Brassica napus TaxID=3708 RepID=A0ABQ7YAG6_BRANA|nr:hypothetical protein HID58_082419 [Brassica napus]